MIPPSIDGTDITGATIDGTDVTEITVDGDTVFTSAIELPASTVLHLDATQLNLANNDPVNTFPDTSGNNHDLTNENGSPTFKSTGLNGRPSVEYINAYHERQPNDVVTGATNRTVFVVQEQFSSNGRDGTVSLGELSSSGTGFWVTNEMRVRVDGAVSFDLGVSNNTPSITVYRLDGNRTGDIDARLNGVDASITSDSNTSLNTNSGLVQVGNYVGNGVQIFDGQISEVIITDTALSNSEISDLENELANKYGITF